MMLIPREMYLTDQFFFSPLDIGEIPYFGEHYIVFNQFSSNVYLCSKDPIRIKHFYIGKKFIEKEVARIQQMKRLIDKKFFEDISHQIIEILDKKKKEISRLRTFETDLSRKGDTLNEMAQFAAYLCRTYFDAELFIVGERS